ncbi:hypothetical protein MmiHf6_12380 [Methanimicrococcus hongohii]|uniref:Uncharacterized protein n=1 Tax=Methanimicrococcus hongohii TaxID=3028295 RepID=A0AA96ZSY1_9EURY|nr:hypothetical protein [Methanimicrococcus sp. Hf6]WNY23915.1 hypothetical protein MmiHf6_12380 [Methanimicrococcus sp. Hf6]
MIKTKILMIFLILGVFIVTGLSVCAGDDSISEISIYNSTSSDSVSKSISAEFDSDSTSERSIYNSTNKSANDSIIDEKEEFLELVEYKKVPINSAYSKAKLQNINVSDDTLEAFSRFELWLVEQNVDAKAENISIMYIDDDLRAIENYWVFATRPESKEMYLKTMQNSKSSDVSSNEMVSFMKKIDEKYPVKYVQTGVALFVTVENKEALLSDFSEKDTMMLENISHVILEESSLKKNEVITSNWGSSNPNLHADMSRWAAEKAGFDTNSVNIISNNANAPDFFSIPDNILERNYDHYYNPRSNFGGAPIKINEYYHNINSAGSMDAKCLQLSYASHYMADLSMPLHTNYAGDQSTTFFDDLPYHFAYEANYVGANWTTGHNFSRFAKDVNSGYFMQDPGEAGKALAGYAYLYSDEARICGEGISNSASYIPTSSIFYATAFCIDEGQRYLIGLMEAGFQEMSATGGQQNFVNQQDITFQLARDGVRVSELDLTNLRVSMGAGDAASIYLNGRQILKFMDSSAGGNLYIYNATGGQLGSMSKVNGKTGYENMTFDISFIHDGSQMTIEIQKYYRGVPNGSIARYSYTTLSDISTLRANMTGYQSNVDYISGNLYVDYEPTSGMGGFNGYFENEQDITLRFSDNLIVNAGKLDLTGLRVSMGNGDVASINLNNRQILKFVDSSAGGALYIYDQNGNQLGTMSKINGKPSFENMTFDVSFTHDGSRMTVEIQKYYRGVQNGSVVRYSYMTTDDISTMRAYINGYQSNVDYISSQYDAIKSSGIL